MDQFKYISNLSIEEINNNCVIPCIDENGFRSILIKNKIEKTVVTNFSTDNMSVKLDNVLYFNDKPYYFHILTSLKNDFYSIEQFEVIYEYIFKKLNTPIHGYDLTVLISSIEDYFRITPEQNLLNFQTGVYGELLTIKILYDLGYKEIIEKYHNNFYSKHDVEINEKIRIEIKSTKSEKRIHTFKHNQIARNDIEVFVCSLLLEQAKEGLSLSELFDYLFKIYSNPDSIFALEKLKKRCNINDASNGVSFSYEKALNDFKVFNAKKLPQLINDIPDGVTNIKYDVDCSFVESENIDDFIEYIKK